MKGTFMASYTNFFTEKSQSLLYEEDFTGTLKICMETFRSFDRALDTFIAEHGYNGDIGDIEEKTNFIKDKFKASEIPVPRNIRRWYTEHIFIERKTAFQICFAFQLDIVQTEDFMRRICLMRSFDYHNMEEIVYCFSLKHKINYCMSQEIISSMNMVKPYKFQAEEPVYTKFLENDIENINSVDELVKYLNENAEIFEYNNATAYHIIQTVWNDIAKPEGLAIRERRKLYKAFDDEDNAGKKSRKRVEDSVWEICLQILGLSGSYADSYYKERSLKSILKDNDLLHPLAENCFPDRDGLNKVLTGRHVSYERVRKLLILLVFYKFWVIKALNKNDYYIEQDENDLERCKSMINEMLVDVGYPTLYPGNPYDFIFLASMSTLFPLLSFRDIMREIYGQKSCVTTGYEA